MAEGGPGTPLPERPMVSALIPVRDGARFLSDAIGGIKSQDYEPVELLVVENGSTDHSLERARELAPDDIVLQIPGSNSTTARNHLIDNSSGELLGFCDADDIWAEGRVSAMVEALRVNPRAGLVFGQLETFHCPLLSEEERRRLPAAGLREPATFSTTMLARRELVDEVGPMDVDAGLGDFGEWLGRARLTDWEELRIDDLVLHRRLHTASLTFANPDRHREYATAMAMAIRARRRAQSAGEPAEEN